MHVSVLPKIWDPGLLKFVGPPTGFLSFYTHILWGTLFGYIFTRFKQEINKSNEVDQKLY